MASSGLCPSMRTLVLLLWLSASALGVGYGQGLPSLTQSAPAAPAATTPPDDLNRTTPRDSVYNLLEACHADRLTRAASYLDLSKIPLRERSSQGPELARTLCDLLDRNPRFEVRHLTTAPEGHLFDDLAPNLDRLASFDDNGSQIELLLQQKEQDGRKIWLVAAESVPLIPQLAAHAEESPGEKRLPSFLVERKLIGTPLWICLGLILAAVVITFVSRLLVRLLVFLLSPVLKKYAQSVQTYHLQTFFEPLRLLVSIVVFRTCLEFLTPSALLRAYLLNLLFLLFVLGAASIVMRIVDVISDRISSRLDPKQRAISYSVLLLVTRCVKVIVFGAGILLVLQEWGYPMTTVLAGLGVGGLAVALAAQKTIENLFGGVSVISDRPVLVGDFCQFGGQVGTVEDIGLRSTRIRTLDRTVVTVPNSQFSSMTLENFSRRDRMWFHPALQLRRDTPAAKIREMMNAIEEILREHPKVDPTTVPTRFTKIQDTGYQIEIFAYVLTPVVDEFLVIQSQLLLQIIEKAEELGVRFSVPFQESMITPSLPESQVSPGPEVANAADDRSNSADGHVR
jgi:MscS family membrane protein